MDEKERSQFVDDLLEASLSRYSSVTPRAGLDGRVLAHSRAAQERRARFVWAGWLVVGAAAVMMTVGVLNFTRRQVNPATPKPVEVGKTLPATPPGLIAAPPARAPSPLAHSTGQTRRANPISGGLESRLPMFPSPSPMTDQEKLLVQFVRATPAEVLSATASESKDIQ